MNYEVYYQKKAEKWILANKKSAERFLSAFEEISKDIKGSFQVYDIVKLKGNSDFFRLRIGKYRAIFTIQNDELIILVINIDSRGGIYK